MAYKFNPTTGLLDISFLGSSVPSFETDPLSLHLDQTTPQSMTGLSDGFIGLISGVISNVSETDPNSLHTNADNTSGFGLSNFSNDLGNYGGWLTYWDTISYADNAWYASSADYANYSNSTSYWGNYYYPSSGYDGTPRYLYNDGYDSLSWQVLSIPPDSFANWLNYTTTSVTPSGGSVMEVNNGATEYARYGNWLNSSIAEWGNGTDTFTIGATNFWDYLGGTDNFFTFGTATYTLLIEGGTKKPAYIQTTKATLNTIEPIIELSRATTGTPAIGLGGSQDLYLTDLNGNPLLAGKISIEYTDVTLGAESTSIKISVLRSGTMTVSQTFS